MNADPYKLSPSEQRLLKDFSRKLAETLTEGTKRELDIYTSPSIRGDAIIAMIGVSVVVLLDVAITVATSLDLLSDNTNCVRDLNKLLQLRIELRKDRNSSVSNKAPTSEEFENLVRILEELRAYKKGKKDE